jgi:hypothetical protein
MSNITRPPLFAKTVRVELENPNSQRDEFGLPGEKNQRGEVGKGESGCCCRSRRISPRIEKDTSRVGK